MSRASGKPEYRIIGLVLWLWCLTASCSVQQGAPENQLIEGPFSITQQWQVFPLAKPLKTNPHVQMLEILLDESSYTYDDSIRYGIISGGFKHLPSSKPLQPEVMLIDESGKEFKPVYKSIGTSFTPVGNYKSLGFGTNSRRDKFFYPQHTRFTAIKVRSNTPFTAEHFRWLAARYEMAPSRKWENVGPADIAYE